MFKWGCETQANHHRTKGQPMLPDRANMYSDDSEAAPGGDSAPSGGDDSYSESQTALVPKTVFGDGVKPGDTVTLKAVAVHGDEVQCEKSGGEDKEEGAAPTDEGGGDMAPSAPGGLSSMLSD